MIVENALFSMEVPEMAACKGQVRFTARSTAPHDLALLGVCATASAGILFERLQAQGTNLLFHVGKSASRVEVLARYEQDGVDLTWQPQQAEEAQLAQTQERIKNKTFMLQHPKEMTKEKSEQPQEPTRLSEAEEDFLVRQLHRIP